jgi:hypothetical protein
MRHEAHRERDKAAFRNPSCICTQIAAEMLVRRDRKFAAVPQPPTLHMPRPSASR